MIVLLRLTGEGEVFFRQERIGRGGKRFGLIKFATMLKDSPNLGTGTVTMSGDPRILPIGGVLRKTKINELPQLINVLVGEMSLIGPRPLTKRTFEAYPCRSQRLIEQVRPGLSGIGSIVFRDEEEIMKGESASLAFYDTIIAPYKGDLEAWYVEKNNLFVYFAAIVTTLLAVFFPKSQFVWRIFPELPVPPVELRPLLLYRRA